MFKKLIFISLTVLLSPVVQAFEPADAITIQLEWLHQFESAGFYAALDKGFYAEAGLDVVLKESTNENSPIDAVLEQRAQFGVGSSGLIKSYLDGNPVLMLAPIFQHSPDILVTRKGLNTPAKLAQGELIGNFFSDENLIYNAMFMNEGIELSKLNIAKEPHTLKDFISGKVVATNAFLSNEPYLLDKANIPHSVIDPKDYGMDFYTGILFTTRGFEKAHPKVVAALRAATLKGWEYALTHQDEIVGLILAKYNTQEKSREHLLYEAKVVTEHITPDLVEIGHSNHWRWEQIAETYANLGMIDADFNLDAFFYDPNPSPPNLTKLYSLLLLSLLALGIVGAVAVYIYRTNEKLKVANKVIADAMQVQHQFTDMLTHELKGLISVVSMFLETLSDTVPLKPHAQQSVLDMDNIIERCQQVNLLENKVHKIKPEIAPCNIEDMLKDLKANSGDASRFNIDVNPLPEINTDAQLLKILLLNLFNNALKYSKPESMIDVEAAHWHEDGYDFLQVMVVNDPGAAGMPDPEKVFSKFYRSAGAKKQSGSGLGLYLFKSFAILLGGKVRYDTFKGKVRFTVWITA